MQITQYPKKITVKKYREAANARAMKHEDTEMILVGHDDMEASDGSHTFGELYEHRYALFIALCRLSSDWFMVEGQGLQAWRSNEHADPAFPMYPGYFILGLDEEPGRQISYHLPMSKWEETNFAKTLERAPKFDGHTGADVINRLSKF